MVAQQIMVLLVQVRAMVEQLDKKAGRFLMRPAFLLFVFDPLDHLFDAWLFALHEDADAVDFGRKPDGQQRRRIKQHEGNQ